MSEELKLEQSATESTAPLMVADIRKMVARLKEIPPPPMKWVRYQKEIFEANHRER